MNEKEKATFRDEFEKQSEQLDLLDEETFSKNDSKNNKIIRAGRFIEMNYDIRFNVVTGETFVKYTDEPEDKLRFFDDREYWALFRNLQTNKNNIAISENSLKALIYSRGGIVKDYHPFKDYLLSLPEWDNETDHIKEFLKSVMLRRESDRDYFLEWFKKWFVALVVTIYEDEIDSYLINQMALIFISQTQAKKKSTWLRGLLPKQLRKRYYYEGSFDTHNKDHEFELARNIIINMEELDSFNKNDIDALKSKITQMQIKQRPAYGRANIVLKRRASFCGSTNNLNFLRDPTGNRRWFAVEIDYLDYDPEFNLDLIYSQAFAMYKQGFCYWLEQVDIDRMEEQNENFVRTSIIEDYLFAEYDVVEKAEYNAEKKNPESIVLVLTAGEILSRLCGKHPRLNSNDSYSYQIAKLLNKYDCHKIRRKVGKKTRHLYAVKPIISLTSDSIKDNERDEEII